MAGYIEALTDADMDETELAIGAAHYATGLDPIMYPRAFGPGCVVSRDPRFRQLRLVRFQRHRNADGQITRPGGVLRVTANVEALPPTARLDVPAKTRSRGQLSVAGKALADEIEARASNIRLSGRA